MCQPANVGQVSLLNTSETDFQYFASLTKAAGSTVSQGRINQGGTATIELGAGGQGVVQISPATFFLPGPLITLVVSSAAEANACDFTATAFYGDPAH